jgi:diguanylate cyclase (GGDEF)-like protein/PAS domain S-box-containing protein
LFARLAQMTAYLHDLVALCPDPIIGVNRAGIISLFNVAAQRLLGYDAEEVIGKLSIIRVYATVEQARDIKRQLYASPDRQIEGFEAQLLAKSGRVIDIRLSAKLLLRDGQEVGSLGFFHDLTERKRLESELKRQSITDSLTGLHNQRHFLTLVKRELERAKRYGRPLSLACIDLDNFKQVNDALGHLEGDDALRFTARLILEQLRETDLAFRYGGDEFMVLLPEADRTEADIICSRLKASFDRCWSEEWSLKLGCPTVRLSIGVAEFDRHESLESLVRRSDDAMYEAKRHGRTSGETVRPS